MLASRLLLVSLLVLLAGSVRAQDPYLEAMEGDRAGMETALMGMGNDLVPGNGDLVEARAEVRQGRVFVKEGRRYIRVELGDTFEQISREAYGDPEQWFLIYYHNRHFLAANDGSEEVILYLPPPPNERVRELGSERMLMVIPGDTFTGIASQLYGSADRWHVPYQANKLKIPDPEDPTYLFRDPPEALSKIFMLPPYGNAGSAPTAYLPRPQARLEPRDTGTSGGTTYARGSTTTPGTSYQGTGPAPSSSEAAARPLPTNLRELRITSPDQIGEREARLILEAAGFMTDKIYKEHARARPGKRPARSHFEAALMSISWGNRFRRPSGPVPLDGQMKQWLFEEYTQLTAALRRYQGWSEVSQKHRPREYEQWVSRASTYLTNVPQGQREQLMKSLMSTESGRTHWQGYRPITSYSGEVGFGQFLPGTARRLGINRYDPAENIIGIAKLINQNLGKQAAKGRHGTTALREALAQYNGGGSPPPRSYRYADRILKNASLA